MYDIILCLKKVPLKICLYKNNLQGSFSSPALKIWWGEMGLAEEGQIALLSWYNMTAHSWLLYIAGIQMLADSLLECFFEFLGNTQKVYRSYSIPWCGPWCDSALRIPSLGSAWSLPHSLLLPGSLCQSRQASWGCPVNTNTSLATLQHPPVPRKLQTY